MNPLHILKKEESLFESFSNAGKFMLKAKDTNLEVVYAEAKAGKSLFLHPYECENAMYLFYFLSGRVSYAKEHLMLGAGDCISAKDLAESEYFEFIEDTSLLIVTQKAFFDHQSEYLLKLSEEMAKIQEKDSYTEEHCNRTGNLALRLSIGLGLANERVNDLLFASKIHDIGKIQVPTEVLNKPGIYNAEDFEIMKQHSAQGYELIREGVSEREAQIVLQHHEKCNGSGYPNRLTKEEILLEARILAVADAYDALTSTRPYRGALSDQQAFDLLWADRDVLWDGQVLEALKNILIEDKRIGQEGENES